MFKVFSIIFLCALTVAVSDKVTILPSPSLATTLPLYPKSTFVAAQPTHVEVHEPTLAKVGDLVESIPTAVSHQSSTIVHSKAQRITPLVTPALRSYTAPAIRTFTSPAVPLLRALPLGFGSAATFIRNNNNNNHNTNNNNPIQLRSFGPTAALYGFTTTTLGRHPLIYSYANA